MKKSTEKSPNRASSSRKKHAPQKVSLPDAHPNSLYWYLSWIRRPQFLAAYCIAVAALNLAVIIVFAENDHYNLDMYTYWNFLMVTVLAVLIALGLLVEGVFEVTVALVYAPMVLGSVVLVVVIVAIVIWLDPYFYIKGTTCDGGTLTFDKVRTGDWILHGFPYAEIFGLMVFDYKIYLRTVLFHLNRSRVWWKAVVYYLYFCVCPLIPMGIYSLINNPAKKYPTPLPEWSLVPIPLVLCLVIQTLWYCALIVTVDDSRKMVQFYSAEQLESTSKRKHPGLSTVANPRRHRIVR